MASAVATARRHVLKAVRGYAAGRCLVAGQEIDRAYVAIGRAGTARGIAAVKAALRRVDAKFERTCVRKSPKR